MLYTGSLVPAGFSGVVFTCAHFKTAQISSLCNFHYISEGILGIPSFSPPLKRTIFSFYDNFTVQWQGYFKVWINQQAIKNESRKYCSVEAIWYHFLKYKNTSSRDFQGPTKQCLTETTHPNGTKCLSYSMLFDRVLVGLRIPLQLQYMNLVGFLAGTFFKSGVENIPC